MLKTEAIQLLGGSHQAAAEAIGVTTQAIYGWPKKLTKKLEDRVLAALYRKQQEEASEQKARA
jgi:hypothetical protein